MFAEVPQAPPDPIFGVAQRCKESKLEKKYLLSVGVYQDENGKPYVFPSVSEAEDRIIHKFSKNYLPMTGYAPFIEKAQELLWGPILPEIKDRLGSLQSAAGTGALYLVSKFIKNFLHCPKVLLTNPAWANYKAIFGSNGHELGFFPWIKNCVFDLQSCLEGLRKEPEGCFVILQACAHNPSGVDPSPSEWQEIFKVIEEKKFKVCFDFAYMGFASGDMDTDASIVREYAKSGHQFFVTFSFSKIMGLYAERCGCLHVLAGNADEAKRVVSQLAVENRRTISNCPQNGALIAATILGDNELKAKWHEELNQVTKRIIDIRNKFADLLEQKTGKSWEHIRRQHGMFALTGLTPEQVTKLGDEQGVFLPQNGRVSIPALNNSNVDAVAQAIANIVKT